MQNHVLEIKARTTLEDVIRKYDVDLKPGSGFQVAVCPLPDHQDSKPSFRVYDDGHYHCYGCQAHGDLFNFVMEMEGIGFKEALQILARMAGVELKGDVKKSEPLRPLFRVLNFAQSYFTTSMLKHRAEGAYDYAASRGLSRETLERYHVGYAPDDWQGLCNYLQRENVSLPDALQLGVVAQSSRTDRVYDYFRHRMIFPIHDFMGKLVGFGGRLIGEDEKAPKYLNSRESQAFKKGDHLYGLFQARKAINRTKEVHLLEGYMDVLSMAQFGYENSCGYLGTAFTKAHAQHVSKVANAAYLIPDGDEAGRQAAFVAATAILQEGIDCWVVDLPDGEDIDEILQRKGGIKKFQRAKKSSSHAFAYIAGYVEKMPFKDRACWVCDFLEGCNRKITPWVVPRLAGALGVSEFEIRKMHRDAPGMYEDEYKVLQFLSSYPAYSNALIQLGVVEMLTSDAALSFLDKINEGETVDIPSLPMEGRDVVDYFVKEIKPLF